jgi:DNA-binding MarR family transcriptional regulator
MAGVKMTASDLKSDLELDLILIDDIRAASRQMVRELGFMDATIAATDYPPSAVHAILEIGMHGPIASAQLADILCLEKSSVSRMVRKLIDNGELKETSDAADARIKPLSLTSKGRRTLAALHDFGRRQVSGALNQLTDAERRTVREGLMLYARALRMDRAVETEAAIA